MKAILYIKGSSVKDVRIQKFITYFNSKSLDVYFWGWDRIKEDKFHDDNVSYLLRKGGYNNKYLFFYYPLWVIIVFFKLVFTSNLTKYNIIAINFECGLPVYLASKIKKIQYIYEIYDEFSISHNFPNLLKKVLEKLDHKVMRTASCVIHVDENRITYDQCNSIVIENSPYDYYENLERKYEDLVHAFAIIGNISRTRGIDQIYLFAKENPEIQFLLAGTFYDIYYKKLLLSLKNVAYYDRMSQLELFSKIEKCCGIFSLYDPALEINRLAASNKVYDAMMLGIPVITNPDVVNSKFVSSQNVGVIINYKYDKTWDILAKKTFVERAKVIGQNGRRLYLDRFRIEKMIEDRLIPLLK